MLQLFKKRMSNRKGFTLVELLVVVSIIGILAAIAVPRFQDASSGARGAKVLADLRTIDSASQLHYAQKGTVASTVKALADAGYLASEPAALTAGEKFKVNNTEYTAKGAYTIDATSGRALYSGNNADAIIAGTATF